MLEIRTAGAVRVPAATETLARNLPPVVPPERQPATRQLRRAAGVAALVGASVAAAACGPATIAPLAPVYGATYLTSDAGDRIGLEVPNPEATVASAAPTNRASDNRIVFWLAGQAPLTAGQSCATWDSQAGPFVQQGLAFHITTVGGVTRAVTVTKNVLFGQTWVFNVHVWDTSVPPALFQIGSYDLSGVFTRGGAVVPFPWRICVVFSATSMQFKAWPLSQPEPAYGDPGYGGGQAIPPPWQGAGNAGWYVGHLNPGGWAIFTGLSAGPTSAAAQTGRNPAGSPTSPAPTTAPPAAGVPTTLAPTGTTSTSPTTGSSTAPATLAPRSP